MSFRHIVGKCRSGWQTQVIREYRCEDGNEHGQQARHITCRASNGSMPQTGLYGALQAWKIISTF